MLKPAKMKKNILFVDLLLKMAACSPTEEPPDSILFHGVITFNKPLEQFLKKQGNRIVLSFVPIEDHKMDFGSIWKIKSFQIPQVITVLCNLFPAMLL